MSKKNKIPNFITIAVKKWVVIMMKNDFARKKSKAENCQMYSFTDGE
jgi:hypothetical protein